MSLLSSLTTPFTGEETLRLGVTGLSRAGKTVFITALVANLLDRGRMHGLTHANRIEAVHLQPQPDLTLPRFAYEDHLAALTGDAPHWPQSTRALSELRLSFLIRPSGLLAGFTGPRRLHLDILDYPGEWLLDLALMDLSYAEWSEAALDRAAKSGAAAADFLANARAADGSLPHDEARARTLAEGWTAWLTHARAEGLADCTPGRFLLPGDLAGSPVLTFAPLPLPALTPRGSLWREMERRYNGYKSRVVTPFFRDHFARLDRQILLADVLTALHHGPRALDDLRRTLAAVLGAFRHGQTGWLAALLGQRRITRLLFAATKADHLHHGQHAALTALTAALLAEAKSRADYAGAMTEAMAIAAFRATVEEETRHEGQMLGAVRGRLENGKTAVLYPGQLPEDPVRLLSPARQGAERWLGADFALMAFAPPLRFSRRPGEGPPFIRLDRAVDFLIGDRL